MTSFDLTRLAHRTLSKSIESPEGQSQDRGAADHAGTENYSHVRGGLSAGRCFWPDAPTRSAGKVGP